MNYLFNRLKEPSTYVGIAVLADVLQHAPSVIAAATTPASLGIGLLGVLGVVLRECPQIEAQYLGGAK